MDPRYLVEIVSVVALVGFLLFWRRSTRSARYIYPSRTRQPVEVISPEMGFPVEPGIQNWQRHRRDELRLDEVTDISELLVNGADSSDLAVSSATIPQEELRRDSGAFADATAGESVQLPAVNPWSLVRD